MALNFMLVSGIVLMILGFLIKSVWRCGCFIISGLMWFFIGVFFPALTDVAVPQIGWAFIIVGMFNVAAFFMSGYEVFTEAHLEPWQKRLRDEEEYGY